MKDDDDVPIRGVPIREEPNDLPEDIDDLSHFISEQVERMQAYLKIGAGKELSFYELEEALKGYSHVHLSLISLHTIARIEAMRAREEYDTWYAKRFVSVRSKHNLHDLSAQKWASQKELDCLLRSEFTEEMKEHRERMLDTEEKEAFCKNLALMWERYSYILSTLSNNVRAEAGTAGFDSGLRN